MSERGAISPERDEIVGERGAEMNGAVCCDFEWWSGGANTHVSGEREFSPLSSAHMLWSGPDWDAISGGEISHSSRPHRKKKKRPKWYLLGYKSLSLRQYP